MFQFTKQQIDTFQRHANKQARKRLLESLIEEGVDASEQHGSDDIVIRDGKGAESKIRYRDDSLISELIRPSGKSTRFDYDRAGLLKSISYPGNIRHEFVRNSLGQVQSFSISGKSKYSFSYRDDHRISQIQFPDNREVGFDWSSDGALQTFTDRCGNKNHYHRTQAGDSVTDCLGRKRLYKSDQEGKLEALLYPDGTREEYAFDEDSNAIEVIQRNGSWILLQLDDQGSPGAISWQDGRELELKFDDQSRLVAAKAGDFEVSRVYTENGQIALESTIAGPVEYQYDPNGRIASYTTPFGDKVQYEYDEDGLLIGILDWEKRRIQIDYAENDTPSRFTFPNGVVEDQVISAAPYFASSILQGRSGMISEHAIEADECDRVRRVIDRWGRDREDRLDRRLEYDKEDRLVAELNVSDGNALASFAYDAVGNMIQDNGQSIEFASMNQPLKRGDQSIDYDSLGNASRLTTSRGRVEATYTEDNRLRVLRSNGQEYRYEYDGLCRRIRKTNGKETWEYGWSGSQLLWEEYFPAPKAESIRRDYLYLPNTATPIAFREQGKTYWIQSDFRGAVIAVHDEAGTIVWRGVYESFGACTTPINQVRQPWRLAGQYFDDESGLHYNLARYYCPKNKTYLSLDPRWQEPEATNYSYARNAPWNRADPLGMLAPLLIGIAAGAIIGGAVCAYMAEPGERGKAFAKGALIGGGAAAIGGLAAIALPAAGAFAATAIGGLALIGVVEGAAGSLLENPTCLSCALLSAGIGGVLGVAMPFVGGLFARKLVPKLKPIIDKLKPSGSSQSPKVHVTRVNAKDPARGLKGKLEFESHLADGVDVFNKSKMTPDEISALERFRTDTNSYTHGRRIAKDLGNKKTGKEIVSTMEQEVSNGKCKPPTSVELPDGQTMQVYEYPDGSVVRIKPNGDFDRKGLTYSVEGKHSGKKNPDGSWGNDDINSAAFKIDENGNAVPKNPGHVKRPFDESSGRPDVRSDAYYANEYYTDAAMDSGHKGPYPP